MLKNILKSLASRKNRNRRSMAKRTLAFENLQNRELMAADMGLVDPALADAPVETVELGQVDNGLAEAVAEDAQSEKEAKRRGLDIRIVNGTLEITAGDGNDKIEIVKAKKNGQWVLIIKHNGNHASTENLRFFTNVKIVGNGGKDEVTFKGTIGGTITFEGGACDDSFTYTGKDACVINGGAGDDDLQGGGGNDVIHGGAGEDEIAGGEGADKLYGDAGNDTFWDLELYNTKQSDGTGDIFDGGSDEDIAYYGKSDPDCVKSNVEHALPISRGTREAEPLTDEGRDRNSDERNNPSEEESARNETFAHDAYFASLGEEQDEKCDEEEAQKDRPSSVQAASQTAPEVVDLVMGHLSLLV